MLTVLEVIKRTTEFFAKRGVESPRLNAELLIGHALALKRMQLYLQFERPLTEVELEVIRPLVKRRGNREPLQHIVGETEFGGLTLKVDRRALIPRPETEYLIEMISGRLTGAPGTILDLGTGSGAIALALAKRYPESAVTAVDASRPALELAQANASKVGLSDRVVFLESDWFSGLPNTKKYSLIVSNPPYLSDLETEETEREVRDFEPISALSAGSKSDSALLRIVQESHPRLEAGGMLACETGIGHHATLIEAATRAGFARVESHQDLTGRDRYLLAFC